MKLLFLFFVAFPTVFSYFVVYYIKYPHASDAKNSFYMAPLFLVLTVISQIAGIKFINKLKDESQRKKLTKVRYIGLIIGLLYLFFFFFII